MSVEKELTKRLEDALNLCNAGIISLKKSGLIEACVDVVRDLGGYKVTAPFEFYWYTAKNLDDLRLIFYNYIDQCSAAQVSSYREEKRDRAIIKALVQSRTEVNDLSKEETIKECAEIIKTIFEYQSEFNFTIPITIEMLRPGKMGWIVEKAIGMMNSGKEDALERRAEEHARKFLEEQEDKRCWLEFNFEKEEKEDG